MLDSLLIRLILILFSPYNSHALHNILNEISSVIYLWGYTRKKNRNCALRPVLFLLSLFSLHCMLSVISILFSYLSYSANIYMLLLLFSCSAILADTVTVQGLSKNAG